MGLLHDLYFDQRANLNRSDCSNQQEISYSPPYLHITVHYPFTIKDGFSEDDIFRVLTRFLSQDDSPTFSIHDILWLHKDRNKNGNIIAIGIDQSGDFENIRMGLTWALHPYIIATAPWEKEPQYKTKARPHISIAYRLDYHTAKLLYNELIEQQRGAVTNSIFHTYPLTNCRVPQLMSVLLTEFLSAFKIFSVFVEIDFVVID